MGATFSNLLRSLAHLCENASLHSSCCTEREGFTCDYTTAAQKSEREHDLAVESWCCDLTLHDGEPLEQ